MSEDNKKRILVTGISGFGGEAAQAYIDAGYEVLLSTSSESGKVRALKKFSGVKPENILIMDFTSEEASNPEVWNHIFKARHIDAVFNGAMVTPKNEVRADWNPERTRKVNVEAATAIFEAAADRGVSVVQLSTHNAHELNNENDHYRITKNEARINMQRLVEEKGLNAVEVQPGMATTPGKGHYRLEILAALPFNMKLVGPGKRTWQPISLNDLKRGIVGMTGNLLAKSDKVKPGHVYKAAGPTPTTYEQYIEDVRGALGHKKAWRVPMPMPVGYKWVSRILERVFDINVKLPVKVMGNFDGFDIQEMSRNFEVSPEETEMFLEASDLDQLEDPLEPYKQYAKHNKPYGPVEALVANMGIDLRSRKKAKQAKTLPPYQQELKKSIGLEFNANSRNTERKKVLVVGATGFVGPAVVEELLRSGHKVVAAVRNIEKAKRELEFPGADSMIEFMKVDLNEDLDPEIWMDRLKTSGITGIVNNAGIATSFGGQSLENVNTKAPLALFEAARRLKKENDGSIRVVQISTTGVDWEDCDDYEYPRTKKATDEALSQMDDLDWVIVKPNVIVEPGRGHMQIEQLVKTPIIGYVRKKDIQPINNKELAIGVSRLMEPDNEAHQEILDATGPTVMSWKELFSSVRLATGYDVTLPVPVPIWVAQFGAKLIQMLPNKWLSKMGAFANITPETIDMMTKGSIRDNHKWVQYTKIKPTNMYEAYAAFHEGPEAYDIFNSDLRTDYYTGSPLRIAADGIIPTANGNGYKRLNSKCPDTRPKHPFRLYIPLRMGIEGLTLFSKGVSWLDRHTRHSFTRIVSLPITRALSWIPTGREVVSGNDGVFFIREENERTNRAAGKTRQANISRNDIVSLFPEGNRDTWPGHIVIAANDPMGSKSNMSFYLRRLKCMMNAIGGRTLQDVRSSNDVKSGNVAGKLLVIGKHHDFGSPYANLLMTAKRHKTGRVEVDTPALDIGKTLFMLCVRNPRENFGAVDKFIVRDDADVVLNRVTGYGFSQGGQIITDAFRHCRQLLHECALIKRGDTYRAVEDSDVENIFQESEIIAMADMDMPYNEGEFYMPPRHRFFNGNDFIIHAAGINQNSTCHNDHTTILPKTLLKKGDLIGHAPELYFEKVRAPGVLGDVSRALRGKLQIVKGKSCVREIRSKRNEALLVLEPRVPQGLIHETCASLRDLFPNTATSISIHDGVICLNNLPAGAEDELVQLFFPEEKEVVQLPAEETMDLA